MNGKATRPSRAGHTPSWRERQQRKKARATKLAEMTRKAEKDEPLFEEGEGDE